MTSRDFVYWLQGFFEISECKTVNEAQVQRIRKHLDMVFTHEIDPSMGDADHQKKLSDIHNGGTTDNVRPKSSEILLSC